MRRSGPVLLTLCLAGVAACSDPCEESLGVYPPAQITVTGAETIVAPHIGWSCPGFHSDTIEPPPSVAPDGQGNLRVDLTMEPGSTIDVNFGNQPMVIDPAPVDGSNSWSFHQPRPSEPLIIRLCSEEEACALYWVNTYPGAPG
ncbi:MAG TPA: hypothetical protein VFP67_09040 [Acidimicrobiia bacterium]|nr:hypothetical protein [Acidimicrobiia bacterium]